MTEIIEKTPKPYDEYKPSGVEWLGDVPEHWEVKRLKYSFRLVTQKAEEQTNAIALENIESWTGRFIETETEFDGDGIAFRKDDILFGKLRPYLAKVLKAEDAGEAVGDFFVMRPQATINPDYAAFLLRSDGWIDIVDGSTYGSKMPRANWDFMGSSHIPLPSLPEQREIATFLDDETGRIDALMANKQRLIELLKEKRTALISQAVTKGLNPKAKMKASGVEWLGDVPEHWQVKKLRYICSVQTGDKDTVDAEEDGLYPFFVRSQTVERINSFTCDCEAVLTAGDGVGVGKVFHYVNGKFDYHQRVYMFNNFKKSLAMFFFYYFRELFARVALDGGAKSTVDSLRRPMLLDFVVCLPPADEQLTIVKYLDYETDKIDTLVAKVEEAIEKLKEYRTAIISAAVTGKIDVRDVPAVKLDSSAAASISSAVDIVCEAKRQAEERFPPITSADMLAETAKQTARLLEPIKRQHDALHKVYTEALKPSLLTEKMISQMSQTLDPIRRQQDELQKYYAQALKPSLLVQQMISQMSQTLDPIRQQQEQLYEQYAQMLKPSLLVQQLMSAYENSRKRFLSEEFHEAILKQASVHDSWKKELAQQALGLSRIASDYMKFNFRTESLFIKSNIDEVFRSSILENAQKQAFQNLFSSYAALDYSYQPYDHILRLPAFILPETGRESWLTGLSLTHIHGQAAVVDPEDAEALETEYEILQCEVFGLAELHPDITKMIIGAKQALASESIDFARHVLVSLREAFTHLLHRMSPDESVVPWVSQQSNPKEFLYNGKPTRKARFLYICREVSHGPLASFIEKDIAATLELINIFQRVHEGETSLSVPQLKCIIAKTESAISFVFKVGRAKF